MVKAAKKIGMHTIEADYSQWTGRAKIKLDGEEMLSRFLIRPFGREHIETVSVGSRMFRVIFGGMIMYNVTIHEVLNHPEEHSFETNETEVKSYASEAQREKAAIKGQKEKLGKINALLDKLDERLAQGEITEARYRELCEQYKAEAEKLKNQVTEHELMLEVGLKAENEDAEYQEEKPVFILRSQIDQKKKSAALAVVLSFIIPGVGQIYCGKGKRGIGILAFNILLLSMFSYAVSENPNSDEPGIPFLLMLLVWIWNIYDASKLAGKINRGDQD